MDSTALDQLKALHAELLALIDELAGITALPEPERSQLTAVRWRLSRASRARTKLIENSILPHLLALASPAEVQRLGALREQIASASGASSRHVSGWTIDRVLTQWSDYCAASATIRAAMASRIATEKTLLYPLLRRAPLNGDLQVPRAQAG